MIELFRTRGTALALAGLAFTAVVAPLTFSLSLGLSQPAKAAECSEDIGNLSKKRMDIIQALNKLAKTSAKGQLDPALSCPKFRALAEAEKALLDYLSKNKDWCTVPDEAIMTLGKSYSHSKEIAGKACGLRRPGKEKPGIGRRLAARRPETTRRTSMNSSPGASLPDAAGLSLLRYAPPSWQPYIQLARLDRPIGWWLLLLPCWWASLLASNVKHAPPNFWHLALFLIGAVAMRGAGTTYNDILDRNIDAKVERTRNGRSPRAASAGARRRCFWARRCWWGWRFSSASTVSPSHWRPARSPSSPSIR